MIDKKFLKYLESDKITEKFASGSASKVVQKLGSILGKKLGTNINFSNVPFIYENGDGNIYAGYMGKMMSNNYIIKLNFLLSKSDAIVSFDVYKKGISDKPDYTIDMTGLNIVQIVNSIYENLAEDGATAMTESIIERGRPSGEDPKDLVYLIDRFVKAEPSAVKELQNKPLTDVFSGVWFKWTEDKPAYKEIKYYKWVKIVKYFLTERGLTNKTFRVRKNGRKEKQVEDPTMALEFENIVETMEWEKKFDLMRRSLKQLVNGRIESMYVWGDSGTGKSFEVKKTLDDENASYMPISGAGFKTMDDFIYMLYMYRDGHLIVADDMDSLWKNRQMVNIFQALLASGGERVITWTSQKKGKYKDIPNMFTFSSGFCFISNLPPKDRSIIGRSVVIEISMTNEQVAQKMEKTLKDYLPEVPMNIKKMALSFLKEISPGVKSIDMRLLNTVALCIEMDSGGGQWKQDAIFMIKSSGL